MPEDTQKRSLMNANTIIHFPKEGITTQTDKKVQFSNDDFIHLIEEQLEDSDSELDLNSRPTSP